MKSSLSQRRGSVRAALKLLLTFAVFLTSFLQAFQVYAEDVSDSTTNAVVETTQDTTNSDLELEDSVESLSDPDPNGGAESEETTAPETTVDPLLAEVQTSIEGAAQSILTVTKIGDWQAVGLSKAEKQIPSNYVAGLYKTLVANKGTFTLVTDYERTVIGLTAAHQDATKFAGYNLIEKIYNSERMTNQGLNGPLYALIALDSGRYTVPDDAAWTRDRIVAQIISLQKDDGGFALGSGKSDPDMTAMTLIALAPYKEQDAAQVAIGKAVDWLATNQQANGGYLSYGADASESVSQAIIGLSSQGIDPTDDRFTKNGVNLVQKLLSFRKDNGTFSHTPGAASNSIATEQALQALIAYNSFKTGGNRLYDFGTSQDYGWPAQWILGSSWDDTEWQAVAIARAGLEVPDSYLATLPSLAFVKEYPEYALVTDYERIAIALSALRQDATDFDGVNIIANIYSSDVMEAQGTNGLAFALIALDSGEYTTPSDAKWDRTKLLQAILDRQKEDGGFALGTGASDPDITAMTLTALAPYMDQADVTTAGERAVQWLSDSQQTNGGYLSYGVDSSESVAQAIIALSSNGIDPTGATFTKNGITLLDKLFSFYQVDGGFSHAADSQAASDSMATVQAQQALTAYEMYVHGEGRLYAMGKPLQAASIQVEGPQGPIAEGTATGTNVLEALQSLLADQQIPITVTDSAYGKYVSAINNIAAGSYGGYDGWMFDVYRDGQWSFPAVGMDAFELQKSDKVVVYYSGSDTQLVDSIQVTPKSPKPGEAFTVAVSKTASVWNGTSSEVVTTAAADVQVKIGDISITTNDEGIAVFSSGIAQAGIYAIEVTGYVTDQTPSLVRAVTSFVIADPTAMNPGEDIAVSIQVEGPQGSIAEGTSTGSNALQALQKLLTEKQIPLTVTDSSYGKYVSAINNIAAGTYGGYDGWMFNVYRDGEWTFPAVGMADYEVNDSDKLLVYYAGSNTQMVDSIQVTPSAPKAGESFTVAVKQITSVWNGTSSDNVSSVAAGVQVKIGSATATTNANGIATFSSGIAQAGTYSIEVTGYMQDDAPTVVRSTKSLVVGAASNSGNGGSTTSYVTLSVTGDSEKGTILAAKRVELQSGDTAYTVLARELSGKVRSTGSGATLYVQGIDGLSEFDRGPDSGWMYSVNGVFPNYSAGSYTLKANDVVAWRYTKDLGCDLGASVPDGGCDSSSGSGSGSGTGAGSSTGTGSTEQSSNATVIDVPKDIQKDYELKPTKEQASQQITLNIPDVQHKVVLNTEDATDGLPQLTTNKGNVSLSIEQGTKLLSGKSTMELFTDIDTTNPDLLALISGQDTTVESIVHAFLMGAADSSYKFDQTLTLTIKGAKGQLAGFIQNQSFTPIQLFASDEAGKKATAGQALITYAYLVGDDLIIKTNHFTSFVTYTTNTASTGVDLNALYTDAKQISSWAEQSIKDATEQGFVQGSNGKLNPKGSVTRAEFTKLMAAVLSLDVKQTTTSSFKDVQSTAWYSPYVEAAYKAGFITGYNGEFKPNDTVTREQMAVMIVRALGIDEEAYASAVSSINDINKVSSWAQSAVKASLALKLMNGVGSSFDPAATVTREMAFVVAMRSYDYNSNNGTEQEVPAVDKHQQAVETQIALTAQYLLKTVASPTVSTLGGEWTVLGLARSGETVPASFYNTYYANLEKTLTEKEGNLHSVKYTEYDRVILALSALGRNVDDVAGYNLLEKLADFDTLIKQGINGPIFALIALDSNQYEIPVVAGVSAQTTREDLINFILKRQINGGGWALGESAAAADVDVTGMAIQALAPYYTKNKDVKAAVDAALTWLSAEQQADGGFESNNANNAESVSQVIVALTSLGINPHTDARFVKNGHSAIDALLSFATTDGGFYHVKAGGNDNGGAEPGVADPMAADQGMYALVAYDRLLSGKTALYDMTDVK
ncbi:prenyltransferase/squalene oxidase-like repeat protein [Paenibacillus cellulosilyticus]|uniref:Prenyltransferase/squalene oxidase-like repeat protein n=1 Tax=Paenibacillus cellulosilyticus TaxID=375489 RepID=A0A2V2YUI5_9BACL|nr:DUF4430 domain-containing protein [Paenibacillus cellulosilyticus]PWW04760.1 prenyltransferase/squalene oxidase-like repeat protein [Paenibacillus cellulosilyticus]QKS45884.1 DUF4430 domain-containing protein [Paenibacillus cellulosilyticus]